MSKTPKSQRGPRINPAATPITSPASTAAVLPASVTASAKSTAGPAKPAQPSNKGTKPPIQPATNEPDLNTESALMAELTDSLGIGSDDITDVAQPPNAGTSAVPLDGDDDDSEGNTAEATDGVEEDEAPASNEESTEDEESGEVTGDSQEDAGDPDENPTSAEETENQAATDEAASLDMDDEALTALARERKWPNSYLRRIKKITAKSRAEVAARDVELNQLRSEVEELRKNPSQAQAVVTDIEQQLTTEITAAEKVIDFVDDNPNGAQTPDGREWTREELRQERRKAERMLREKEDTLRDVRNQRAAKQREVEALLPTRHPSLKDRTSDHSRAMDTLLSRYPVLKSDPVLRLLTSDATAFALQMQRQQRAAKPAVNGNGHANGHTNGVHVNGNGRSVTPARTAPAVNGPGKPRGAAPAVNGTRAISRKSEQEFFESGDPRAGAKLIESLLGE